MDSITHIFLGAAVGQIVVARRVGFGRAFLIGALAATLPDADALIYTGEAVRDHALHRHFMHSLVVVAGLAFVALMPFMFFSRKVRPHWKVLYWAALLACVTHTLLDSLTSYGTMIFWPFSFRRYALDIISVTDPVYTIPLIIGVCLAWRRRAVWPALVALLFSCLYLGFATLQHARAQAAQRELLAARGIEMPTNPRVLPQAGAVISYRSIYIDSGMIHADAIRVPLFSGPVFKTGGTIPLMTPEDLQMPTAPDALHDFDIFSDLSDGFIARSRTDPLLISDQRYTYLPETFDAVWGIQLEETDRPLFRITARWKYLGQLFRDLFRPRGYGALPAAPPK